MPTCGELANMFRISDPLAAETYARYRDFGLSDAPSVPALFAYDGSVFRHIRPETFSTDDLRYAQQRLRIVSTLYGVLRPMDRIGAYRFEYGLKPGGLPGSLYDYWLPKLTAPLIADAQRAGGTIVNLASRDVLRVLDREEMAGSLRLITPEFMEKRDGRLETVRTYAKMARGEMARHILLERIEDPEELQQFRWQGFAYDSSVSDSAHYCFTRDRTTR